MHGKRNLVHEALIGVDRLHALPCETGECRRQLAAVVYRSGDGCFPADTRSVNGLHAACSRKLSEASLLVMGSAESRVGR